MVTPPEVFSGASWPLAFTESAMDSLERASYLGNLMSPHEAANRMRRLYGLPLVSEDNDDVAYSLEELAEHALSRASSCSAYEQIDRSLKAAVNLGEEACKEIVLAGSEDYTIDRAISNTKRVIYRPNTALQRSVVLAMPYEELHSLETFFDGVVVLLNAGTKLLVEEVATEYDVPGEEVTKLLSLVRGRLGSDWFID